MHDTQHLFLKLNQIHTRHILIIPFVHIHIISPGEDKATAAQVVGVYRSEAEDVKDSKAEHRS